MKKFIFFLLSTLVISLLLIHCKDDEEPPITLKYTLTTEAKPAEGGSISPSTGSYEKGSNVSIKATPAKNYIFKKWSGGATGDSNPISLIMNTDKKVVAEFEIIAPTYTNGEGIIGSNGGTVMIDDSSSSLNGVSIVIPEGALNSDKNIKISLAEGNVKFSPDETLQLVKFEPEGLEFSKPIEVTFPYNNSIQDTSNLKVINYVLDPESIIEMDKKSIDVANKTITSYMNHFSFYTVWESNVKLDVEMIKYNNKVGARIRITGFDKNSNTYGLKHIPATRGYKDVLDFLTSYSTIRKVSNFEITLREFYTASGDDKQTVKAKVMIYKNNAYVSIDGSDLSDYNQVKSNLKAEDIDTKNNNLNTYGEWASGRPLVIWFNKYPLDKSDKLNVKVKWFMSNDKENYINDYKIYSIKYEYNLRSDRKKFDEMTFFNKDQDNNFIHDDYEIQKLKVETLEASNIEKYSAVLNGKVTDNGGGNISERGFYYAKHSDPTENDEPVKVTGGGFSQKVTLESNHNYHYRAYAVNKKGKQLSEDAVHFKTLNAGPEVKITEPAENESFQKGETVTIKATASDDDGSIEKVEFFIGTTKIKTFTSAQSSYSFDWDTSNATKGEKEIKVTATDSDGKTTTTPPRTIIIRDGNLVVSVPNKNTEWTIGDQNVTITWETGELGGNVKLELHKGSGISVDLISNSTPNDGSYNSFDVPQVDEGGNFRVQIISLKYPEKTVFSDYFGVSTKPTVTTANASDITTNSATVGGDVTSDGGATVTERGVYWGTSANPETNGTKLIIGDGTGQFSKTLNSLTQNTTYYIKSYAINSNDIAYGSEISFKTLTETTIPTVTTANASDITTNSATVGGDVTSDGGATVTERGVYWGTSANPETNGTKLIIGDGTGQFSKTLNSLTQNTTYYIKSYAINSNDIAYGSEISFKTLTETTIPTVTTTAITNITQTTATTGGNVTNEGGSSVTAKGIVWSTTPNPTITDNTTNDGTGTGNFTSSITGLTPNTPYYVRAYATNSEGTAYGNQENFTTENSGNSGTFSGEIITVSGGTFNMGNGYDNEQPIHSVILSSFNISKYEITNQQYADYMNAIGANSDGSLGGVEYLYMGSSSSYGEIQITYSGGSFVVNSGKENYPVGLVTWYGAKAYSEYYGGRLPTEAEWEFAARGGNSSNGYTYSGSNTLDDVVWYNGNSGNSTHTVGTKSANELGLHDMSGNVFEWTNDWYDSDYYSYSPNNNPQGPSSGTNRVCRGGGGGASSYYFRVAARSYFIPTTSFDAVGFRPVFSP